MNWKKAQTKCSLLIIWILILSGGTAAAENLSGRPTGPYLGLSPITGVFSIEYEFYHSGLERDVKPHDVLPAWGFELGWRLSPYWSLGFSHMSSVLSEDDTRPDFNQSLLRLDWSPTGGLWWVSLGAGIGNIDDIEVFNYAGEPYFKSGTGFTANLGIGADLPLTEALALRGRGEYTRQEWIPDTTPLTVTGWSLSASIVWFP